MIKNYLIKNLDKHASQWLVLSVDILIVVINFFLAYVIRFGITFQNIEFNIAYQLPVIITFSALSFLWIGSYKGIIRKAGLQDVYNLFLSVSVLLAMCSILVLASRLAIIPASFNIPISIIDMHYLLNIITLITSRIVFKYCYHYVKYKLGQSSRVMIYGAGHSGEITLSTVTNDTEKFITVVGFIDDSANKIGKTINGIKVYANKSIDQKFIDKNEIDEVIVSIPHIDKKGLRKISDSLIDLGVKVKIVPAYSDWHDGEFEVSQIKQIQIEDLLERPAIDIGNKSVVNEIKDKVILITGAAGSIGSEIVRQLTKFEYKHLVLVDQAESALYDVQQELLSKNIGGFTAIVADIREAQRMELIFKEYKPSMVFHAAAYKHVPLMERYPTEAVKINVLGTRKLADLSSKYEVDKFVFVSTDKAVNPTNVMGATKRVAEIYIKCLQKKSATKFITTRFGNVLGSNGSVIPLFKKQIEKGGPITVTHQDVTRYFMTIPEASQLVIEAGTMGKGGEIFIFDMGQSVKIFDLAKKMISLSGLHYPEDIDIKITGLRPGEKLYEELLSNTENTLPTYHKKIMISKSDENESLDIVKDKIDDLCIMDLFNQDNLIVGKIKEIVPEFISNNSSFESIDKKNKVKTKLKMKQSISL
ncbi:polysaccharide biosynthesis protein [Aquimarina agarivorans]|uniref:polysaccharide biosynthesis protein n=1 Tax=Aquimarina agarivorans TaxID=980584 RepID=UPI000248E811|nr:nucleoside-diphosphate sugar epimerase/dehydratase [Aquimarina agarivorans]